MKMPENTQQEPNHDRETRLRFMRITREKSEALREFWPEVEKNLPRILDDFYKQLTAEPVLVKIIGNNQVSRLLSAQAMHWGRLFNGDFDETYIQGVRAALINVSIGCSRGNAEVCGFYENQREPEQHPRISGTRCHCQPVKCHRHNLADHNNQKIQRAVLYFQIVNQLPVKVNLMGN